MKPEDFEHVQRVFSEVHDLSEEERQAYFSEHEHPKALVKEVLALLEYARREDALDDGRMAWLRRLIAESDAMPDDRPNR
ncbi:MAG: hypothetical protein RL885_26465 [Planctomycetota bacterium]